MLRSALLVLALLACAPTPEPASVREARELSAQVERMELAARRELRIALALNAAWAMDEALRCRGVEGR